MSILMMAVLCAGFVSCGDNDEEEIEGVSRDMKSLEGAWRLQKEVKLKRANDGTETVLWEESATDYIIVVNNGSQSVAYAWASDDNETKWSHDIYTFTYIEETKNILFGDYNYKVLSTSKNSIVLERISDSFSSYVTVYQETYKKISNAESLIGDIKWPIFQYVSSDFFFGKWQSSYYGEKYYYWFKSDGTCMEAIRNNNYTYSHYSGTWSYDKGKKELTVSIQDNPITWKLKGADGEEKERYFIVDNGSKNGIKWTPSEYMFPE